MSEDKLKKLKLAGVYKSKEINEIWNNNQDEPLINHPQLGWISPNKFRSLYKNKPCPYCGKKMVQGREEYSTMSKQVAIERGYGYINNNGNLIFNQIGSVYYHPNYITLDHKMNKARFPELMFDFNNLEAICWRCNQEKKDNNSFELENNLAYFNDLYQLINNKYKKL